MTYLNIAHCKSWSLFSFCTVFFCMVILRFLYSTIFLWISNWTLFTLQIIHLNIKNKNTKLRHYQKYAYYSIKTINKLTPFFLNYSWAGNEHNHNGIKYTFYEVLIQMYGFNSFYTIPTSDQKCHFLTKILLFPTKLGLRVGIKVR